MPYTLWSRGRLLASTELAYGRAVPLHRGGDLQPTEIGEAILPIATGVPPARRAVAERRRDPTDRTTADADVAAAADRCDALALELRGPDGAVIPTAALWVQDTEELLACGVDADADADARYDAWDPALDERLGAAPGDLHFNPTRVALEEPELDLHAEHEELEPRELPRYQLFVTLFDDSAVP